MNEKKQHWENVYASKNDDEVSWYQENPVTSLNLINKLTLNKKAIIIDVGGGNSNLIGKLKGRDFTNLSVLDISEKSLEKTKNKLGNNSRNIQWIISDILDFNPNKKYDLWHDRAVFHFLITKNDIATYVNLVSNSINKGGYFILATFSTTGPKKCSGLDITQYSSDKLEALFGVDFDLIKSFEEVHQTPFDTAQNFIYTVFQKN